MDNTQKTILLLDTKCSFNPSERFPWPLLAISSYLYREGYNIKILTERLFLEREFKKQVIKYSKNALCVGITAQTGSQIGYGLRISQLIKKQYPDLPIVWGGYHPTIIPEQTVADSNVDIVVRGFGEITFTELVHRLERNESLDGVQGITYTKNGQIVNNPDRPFEDPNNFPPTPFELVNVGSYVRNMNGQRSIDYMSSRGCPFKCSFCSENMMSARRWAGLRAERVVDELEYLSSTYDINHFRIRDSNFFVDKDRVRKICQGIIERRLKITWGLANGRVDQLNRFDHELWSLIAESGCKDILVGAESGSQHVLDLLDKRITVDDTLKLVETCKKYSIVIIMSMMIGVPQHDDVDAEFDLTAQLIDNALSLNRKTQLLLFCYTPYPGSPLYEIACKSGFVGPKSLKGWAHFNLYNCNIPWLKGKYRRLKGDQLKFSIFHFLNGRYEGILPNVPFFNLANKAFTKLAFFRWKRRWFAFPVDYYIIMSAHISIAFVQYARLLFHRLLFSTAQSKISSDH